MDRVVKPELHEGTAMQGVKHVSQTQISGEKQKVNRSERSERGSNGPKLLDRMRGVLRTLHYSKRTEEAYIAWVEKYLRFHRMLQGQWRHPAEMGGAQVTSNSRTDHVKVEMKL
jgi:hypothetical protein